MIKRFSTLLFLFTFSILITSCADDEEINIESTADFNEFLTDELEFQEIPAMSVLIYKNDEIKYERYLGKANISQNVVLQADHLFLLASISKTITATALLQLMEKDSFKLDDKVNDYLPFRISVPNYTTDITFRMLLEHTSAIGDGPALDGQYFDERDSPVALGSFLRDYLEVGGQYYDANQNFYNFQPGTDFEYSNTGNALIGYLVEVISGKSFNQYCKENIFIPLGMSNTFWRLDEISQTIVTPYDFNNSGQNEAIKQYTFTDYPNGGLRSTVRDMFRFLSGLTQGGVFNGVRFLKESTVAQMRTPQIPTIDNTVGLHLFIMDASNGLWGHDGGEKGVVTIMGYNPSTKVGALIFTNQGDAEVEKILSEAYKIGLTL